MASSTFTPKTVSEKVETLLDRSAENAKSWAPPPTMTELRAKAAENGGAVAVLTCLDPRCVPEQFFGAGFGPAFRNAGGRASEDVIRSMTALRSLANLTGVLVVHHTDCGLIHLTDPLIKHEAKLRTPEAAAEIEATTYGCVPESMYLEGIREDVRRLRSAKVLRGVEIRGMELDTFSGVMREVDVDGEGEGEGEGGSRL